MATATGTSSSQANGSTGKDKPTKSGDAIIEQTRKAHADTLQALTTLLGPLSATASTSKQPSSVPKDTLSTAVDEVQSHAATTTFFGDLFSLIQQKGDNVSRHEVDQKLLNWGLAIPGVKEKLAALPPDLATSVEHFHKSDVSTLKETGEGVTWLPEGFQRPMNPKSYKKYTAVRKAWEAQNKRDGGKKYDPVVEKDGTPVKYVEDLLFENWGDTVQNTPGLSFMPVSIVGVQNIIKYAKTVGKTVRCSGYRHTWTNVFSDDGEILISLLPIDEAVQLPWIPTKFRPFPGSLQQINLLPDTETPDGQHINCYIGTATTNEQFRQWAISPTGGKSKWSLPLNVIMVEITFGGSISAICHGAGINHQTLSDLVVEVEYVDCHGELRTISDPELLRAAAGGLGVFGVVVGYTVRLDKMTYAAMRPSKQPIELAIPPPKEYITLAQSGDPQYAYIKTLVAKHTQVELDAAYTQFVNIAEGDFYAEWFWFPLQSDGWVNCWKNDGDEKDATEIPSPFMIFLEWLEEWIMEEVNNWSVWQALPGELQAKLFGFLALSTSSNVKEGQPTLVTQVENGLHFRHGIQNMQAVDMEWEIPLPAPLKEASEPLPGLVIQRDWSIVQKAWWDAVLQMHAQPSVVRVALELRIMGGSNVILSPELGNTLGTCSIEVLSTFNTPTATWAAFCQTLTDKWISYTDPSTGKPLNTRPHWCKEWSFLMLPNASGKKVKAVEWIRSVGFRNEIPLFLDTVKKIGEKDGYTVEEARARFVNKFLDAVFFGGPIPDDPVELPDNINRSWFRSLLKNLGC